MSITLSAMRHSNPDNTFVHVLAKLHCYIVSYTYYKRGTLQISAAIKATGRYKAYIAGKDVGIFR